MTDVWNMSYPIGGNYWDTYSGNDNYRGASQNIPGSDGIGDTSYLAYWVVLVPEYDYYPFINRDGFKRVLNIDTGFWYPWNKGPLREALIDKLKIQPPA